MAKYKVNNAKSLLDRENNEFMKVMNAKGIIVSNSVPMVTSANINATLGALNYVRPTAVEILTAPTVADAIATPQKNGNFGDQSITVKIKEMLGQVSTFTGVYEGGLESGVNYTNELRGVYDYQTFWRSNQKDEAQVGAIMEDLRADKVNASMQSLSLARNNFFFNGVAIKGQALPIYGMLNDPNLEAYTTVAGGAWENKTPEAIYNDVVAGMAIITKQSNGIATSGNGKWKVCIASNQEQYLNRTNEFGLTGNAKIKEAFGEKVEFIFVPQLNDADADSDCMYIIFEINSGEETFLNSYTEMARAFQIDTKGAEVSQIIMAGTSGAICQYPIFVARLNGLS